MTINLNYWYLIINFSLLVKFFFKNQFASSLKKFDLVDVLKYVFSWFWFWFQINKKILIPMSSQEWSLQGKQSLISKHIKMSTVVMSLENSASKGLFCFHGGLCKAPALKLTLIFTPHKSHWWESMHVYTWLLSHMPFLIWVMPSHLGFTLHINNKFPSAQNQVNFKS